MLYIDVYFIVNWWMDMLLLTVTAVWRKTAVAPLRLLAASGFAALCACGAQTAAIVWGAEWTLQAVTWIGLAGMAGIAFGRMKVKYWLCACGQLLLLSWVAAGILDFLYYHTNTRETMHALLYGENSSPAGWWLFICSLVLSGGGVMAMQLVANGKWVKSPICSVTMEFRERKVEASALMDSGNRLFTHLGAPVTIVERQVMQGLLEPEEWESLNYWTQIGGGYPERFLKFQLVPFRSVGKKEGFIPAIRIDQMMIHKNTGEVVIKNPVIGFSEHAFSEHDTYQVILHSSY